MERDADVDGGRQIVVLAVDEVEPIVYNDNLAMYLDDSGSVGWVMRPTVYGELVLLDEPLSALDAITRRSLQSLLLLLQSEFNKSILMITHDIEEALLLADDVLVLSRMPMKVLEHFSLTRPKPRRLDDSHLLEIKAHVLDRLQQELKI